MRDCKVDGIESLQGLSDCVLRRGRSVIRLSEIAAAEAPK